MLNKKLCPVALHYKISAEKNFIFKILRDEIKTKIISQVNS